MAEQVLDRSDIVTILEQVCGKAVAQNVGSDPLLDHSYVRRARNRALEGIAREVMTGEESGWRIWGESGGGKYELPSPICAGRGVFTMQRGGEQGCTVAGLKISDMEPPYLFEVILERP